MVGDSPVAGPANGLDETSKTFIGNVVRSGLVDLERIRPVVASVLAQGEGVSPQILANALVNAGLLTGWQAKNLLAGRSRGFFLGSYRLLRPLGVGGMGVVYLAEHKVMQRRMALKILPRNAMEDKVRVARFEAEARAAAQLDHANIVRAYDFSTAGGKSFIVMEYVEGVDLHRIVARDGLMSPRAALDAICQAASGLAHAHQRGVIHRDIKPSNLLMRHDGVIKVSDMGLARIGMHTEGSLTMDNPSSVMGTADFLAPEQALDSHTVDGRADIYALGCTLYYLMTGEPPYPGGTLAQRIAKHQTAPPADIGKKRDDCPRAIAELAKHMMAKRPEDRVRSASELVAQIRRIAANLGLSLTAVDATGAADAEREIPPPEGTIAHGVAGPKTAMRTSVGVQSAGPKSMSGNAALFDLSDLPEISLGGAISLTSTGPASMYSTAHATQNGPLSNPGPGSFPSGNFAPAGSKSDLNANQGMMIGMGLAIAVIALIVTTSMVIWTVTREPKDSTPAAKVVEDGKGQNVIILNK